MIGEYLRKVVQQLDDVRVGWCLRVLDGLGDCFSIDYAILGEVHQVFNIGHALRGGFHNLHGIHIRGGKETSITSGKNREESGYIRWRKVGKEKG